MGERTIQVFDLNDEVAPRQLTLGRADTYRKLRLLLKDLGVPLENVMAIGDAENDIEMLKMVGLGVAVSNASDDVKAAAKEVVSSNHDNGVAEAIEKFVLPKEQPKPTPPVEAAAEPKTEAKAETLAAPKAETPVEKPVDSKPEGSAE